MNIKEIRTHLGLKQNEFAELLGVRAQSVCNWEKGKAKISIKSKRKVLELCQERGLEK